MSVPYYENEWDTDYADDDDYEAASAEAIGLTCDNCEEPITAERPGIDDDKHGPHHHDCVWWHGPIYREDFHADG